MDFLLGCRLLSVWTCCTVLIFQLQLQQCDADDACPPQEELEPCTCESQNSERTTTITTTASPIQPRQEIEARKEIPAEERKEGLRHKEAEGPGSQQLAEMATAPVVAPNATCRIVISCNAPSSHFVLEDAIERALSRKWVDKMIFSRLPPKKGYNLVRLPKGFLKELRVKHFEVRDTLLFGDFIHYNNPFEGQEQSMLWFTARNCYLGGSLSYDTVGTVNTKGLNTMPKIEGVDLSRNHLVYVYATAFRSPSTNLSVIILSHNSIYGIEAGSFQYIPNLKRLDMSHNLLGAIARSIFAAPARYLRHIDFSWNQLKVLPTDLFVNMPQLKIVNLKNNFLTSMPIQPWAPVWRQLTYVDVTDNFILCDCSLMWLLPILSPPVAKAPTTPAPAPLPGQTVFGACSYGLPHENCSLHELASLSRGHLNC